MTLERLRQIEQLYDEALQKKPGERSVFLDAVCGADLALCRQIKSLLAHQSEAGSFIETPAIAIAARSLAKSGTGFLEGQTVGPHRILELLGAGGMGEVYRARDTKLKREVAIKILPEEFSRDPVRVARFQREAEVLASLNHPNIAAIYDLEEAEGSRFLVLEFVEGETLAERIRRGPIPVEEALDIAGNICDALEAAHEKGITHRDLKPANIKLTPDGNVKLLDFGLAKAIENAPTGTALSNSQGLSMAWGDRPAVGRPRSGVPPEPDGGPDAAAWGDRPAVGRPRSGVPAEPDGGPDAEEDDFETNAGVILGTTAYMAPEQAKGKTVDRRADIWAFGVVLYEMLTGRMLFAGETASETMAAVMMKEPDWNTLPANVPARARELLRRCLIKEPRHRVRDIGEARIVIEEVQSGAEVDLPQTPARRHSKALVGIAAVLFLTTVFFAVLSVPYFNRAAPAEIRVEVSTPATPDPLSFAISPDGRRLVFSASNEGRSQLWVRPLDSPAAQPLPGTDGASYPFWSPDSASVGFFADGKLKRMDVVGGMPQVLANAGAGRGGTWNREGTIVFAGSTTGPLLKVPATGGEPVAITRMEPGQTSSRFPQFLPDGRHFIYFVQSGTARGVYAGSLDGGPSKRIANADAAAVVSPSGFLLFARQTTLFAQAFDFNRQELSGNPFPVAEKATFDPSTFAPGFFATSGIVAYRTGSAAGARQLTWLNRSGKSVGTIGAPDSAGLADVELSPDGKRVAVDRTVNGNTDIWLIDAARGVPTRFTFDAASEFRPLWSPDGSRVVFDSNRKGVYNLYWKLSSGVAADELLLESDQTKAPSDWSSDGRFLLFRSLDPQTGYDLWVLPVTGDKKPFPFLKTPFEERDGQFSPDGKWIAYRSNESGRFEIYVQPFPGPGTKVQISSNGGAQPRWNKNGKEIFYVSLDSKMMAAPVKLSPDGKSLETGIPAALFPVRIAGGPLTLGGSFTQEYAVSSDGQRFLVNLAADEGAASPITLILNWKPQAAK